MPSLLLLLISSASQRFRSPSPRHSKYDPSFSSTSTSVSSVIIFKLSKQDLKTSVKTTETNTSRPIINNGSDIFIEGLMLCSLDLI